jgi:uncharacterized protein YutE (UPF0331/DUF86 family)
MELSRRLRQLEENIILLEELRESISRAELLQNRRLEWELRYGLFESIQIVIDISCKIANRYNLGNPKNYRECIELLGRHGYLNGESIHAFISMVGLRNLLIHEYAEIDGGRLYKFLEHLDDFTSFISQIHSAL